MTQNSFLARLLSSSRITSAGTITIGPGLGLRFDPGPSNAAYASGDNELHVQQALVDRLRTGAVFYDIGANVGFLTMIGARLVGAQGIVYAFEPVPSNADYVRLNAKANGFAQVLVVEKAVSNFCGMGELNLARYSGGAALTSAEAPPDLDGTMQVEVVSVDASIGRDGLKPPSLIKIDVEGAELEVLEGMEETVNRYRPVVIVEVDAAEPGPLQRKQTACENWLRSRGYNITALPDSYPGIDWLVSHFVATPT